MILRVILPLVVRQWGVGAPYSNKYSVTTLPIPFSHSDYAVMVTNSNLNAGTFMACSAISATQIKTWNNTYQDTYYFFAIGK